LITRHPNIWAALLFGATGLILLGDFAPISDSLDEILSGAGMAIVLAFSITYFWQQWRARQADQSGSAAISSGDQA